MVYANLYTKGKGKCAAGRMCLAPASCVRKDHTCRKCNTHLHLYCAGIGVDLPNWNAKEGKEFECILCCEKNTYLGVFSKPKYRVETEEECKYVVLLSIVTKAPPLRAINVL